MVDQNSQFYAILTNVGAAKQANADALGIPWKITQMGVGDANGTDPTPNATQTSLINEWRRAPLNQLKVDDKNSAIIVAEQVIPADVGGKWIREIALYDADGDMVAVANCAPTYKPLLSQGSGRTQVVRMNLIVSSASNVQLKIDPAVVLATRDYVDSRITEELSKLDIKQSVRVATSVNLSLAGLQTVDGVALVAGDRVLVKSQTAAKENGLYVAAVGTWPRASDADTSTKVTSGLIVVVELGEVLADTIWQLTTDAPITLGLTSLVFQNITDGFARLLSPAFVGAPTAPTPAQYDSSSKLATTDFVKRVGLEYSSFGSVAVNTVLTAIHVGGLISASSSTPISITLPPTLGVAQGATTTVVSAGSGSVTVKAAAGDLIYTASGVVGPIVLGLGDSAEFIKLAGQWRLSGGSSMLRYSQVLSEEGFVTQAQFNSSQRLATTEFVQRALGSFSGAVSYGASITLTKSDAGKIIRMAGTGYTVKLPLISSLVEGTTFAIQHSGTSGTQSVVVQGDDVIDPGAGLVTSLTLNIGDTAILTRAAGNWALTGGSAALGYVDRPTMPQFDSSRQLATTEFVQREIGNYSGQKGVSGAYTVVPADSGKVLSLTGGGYTITLPSISSFAVGSKIRFINFGTGAIQVVGSGLIGTMSIGITDSLEVIATLGGWMLVGGSALLGSSSGFGASLNGTVGYQKLPNGAIEQWGVYVGAPSGSDTVITLPVAMLAVPTCIELTFANFSGGENVGVSPVLQARNSTPGSITVRNLFVGSSSFFWKVRGRV
ncbi:phage tail protein [Pseudomonas carassii]|uniref:Phage tail protein n=1 Tax=Pseudomonas carassii TaxID=3115855 RepID=A0ABU7HAZ6_9PSED|nr:phage tail protein [Pseudomonas sp. 137P]MEE1888492.1 phage tail protein [Pseudomonas sp. 137P]